MTGRSLSAWNQRKQNRAVPLLAILVACAALLAGCDASLQNETLAGCRSAVQGWICKGGARDRQSGLGYNSFTCPAATID